MSNRINLGADSSGNFALHLSEPGQDVLTTDVAYRLYDADYPAIRPRMGGIITVSGGTLGTVYFGHTFTRVPQVFAGIALSSSGVKVAYRGEHVLWQQQSNAIGGTFGVYSGLKLFIYPDKMELRKYSGGSFDIHWMVLSEEDVP